MILYVNGDSHTAAAEAVNAHAFAEDDGSLAHLGRLPHPDNLAVSWGRQLADIVKAVFLCGAESAASNERILRTTRAWLDAHPTDWYRTMVIIQWSTWEREEWSHNGVYYQVGSSGLDHVPAELQEKYRNYVIGTDWTYKTEQAHDQIWQLHQELEDRKIPHVFFNGNNHFGEIGKRQRHNWGTSYIDPYSPDRTFDQILQQNGHNTVAPKSWHFGKDAHRFWSRFMLQYCIDNKLL
jgi:hypothetical protein